MQRFLRDHRAENLFLVGDIIDGWSLRKSWYWDESHNQVVRRILTAAAEGTQVLYVCGNHDEFLRDWLQEHIAKVDKEFGTYVHEKFPQNLPEAFA